MPNPTVERTCNKGARLNLICCTSRMPRRTRIHLPGLPLHIVQRGHNRDACFFAEDDYLAYQEWLGEATKAIGC